MKFRTLYQYCIPQHALSRLIGWFASSKIRWLKSVIIYCYRWCYNIDLQEAVIQDIRDFESFNAFFTRRLLPTSRPISAGNNAIACPVDGSVSQIGRIDNDKLFQAKGFEFSCAELLGGDAVSAQAFKNGHFATLYLSPRDYHRIHMPIDGRLKEMTYIPGKLFAVHQHAVQGIPRLFARNERVSCLFDTAIGPVAIVLVGAFIVGSITTTWAGRVAPSRSRTIERVQYAHDEPEQRISLAKGDELGYFSLGSTAIVLFPENTIRWAEDLTEDSTIKMGQKIAELEK